MLNPNPVNKCIHSAVVPRLNSELRAELGVVNSREPPTPTPELERPAFGDLRASNGTAFFCAGTARD